MTHDKHIVHHAQPKNASAPSADITFADLPLIPELHRALEREGYKVPTPIQAQSIPPLLVGRDLLGCAQTGTGKTAAFTLPLLQYLTKNKHLPSAGRPRTLILAPTRELAAQIGDSIKAYGRFLNVTHTVIFGGVGYHPQIDALKRGMDIVVATPGRLLDLMQMGHAQLDRIEVVVLDEADRMLDMGFIKDVKKIIAKLPPKRHSVFFSATLEPAVVSLAKQMVHDPVHVTITPNQPTVDRIAQKVLFVQKRDKDALLVDLIRKHKIDKVIVFTEMKHVANKVALRLDRSGIRAEAIHGNKSQSARTQALDGFKRGKVTVLVATDIAARGIDIDGVTHVINYDLPNVPETYVHRIGRTARAGAEGDAISFCSPEERGLLRDIERFVRRDLPKENAGPVEQLEPLAPEKEKRIHRSFTKPKERADGTRPPRQQFGKKRFDNRGEKRESRDGPRDRPRGEGKQGERRDGDRRDGNRGGTKPSGRPPQRAGFKPRRWGAKRR
jgi:ATP-dependent RNA helicase RhlE